MFASGDLIYTCRPFAFVLYAEERSKRCDFCFKILEGRVCCHKCHYVIYCSRQCQREGRDMHQFECPSLVRRPQATVTRLLARIISQQQRVGDPEAYDMVDRQKRTWDDLMNHYDDIIHDAAAMFRFNGILIELEALFGHELDIVETIHLYGKVLVNSFAVQDEMMCPIGRAVYLGASVFDHSCVPDASFMFMGTTIFIKAIRDIKVDSIRQVRISYLDELETTEDRISHLETYYYFRCDCPRCNNQKFTMIDMEGPEELKPICDNIQQLGLDSVMIYKSRCALNKQGYRLTNCDPQVLVHVLDTEEKQQLGFKVIEDIESKRRVALSMRSVLSIQIADLISAFEGNVELAVNVIEMFRLYYGRFHPRLAIKLFTTAMTIKTNPMLKQKLLIEAQNITQKCTPSASQQLREMNRMNTPKVQDTNRGRTRCRSNRSHEESSTSLTCFPTLFTLIEKELNATQQNITFKATLSSNKCKWRAQSSTRDYRQSRDTSLYRRPVQATSYQLSFTPTFGRRWY